MIALLALPFAHADTSAAGDSDTQFAIIADLTGGEREGVFEVAVAGLKVLQPDFVLSVGDQIEGGTEDVAVMNAEWDSFNTRMGGLDAPFYPLVGNHDISNLSMRNWWERTIGPRYSYLRRGELLFLMLDTEDFPDSRFVELDRIRTEGIAVYKSEPAKFPDTEYANLPERQYGEISAEQAVFFTEVLDEHRDATWTFVLMHKPSWASPDSGFEPIERALRERDYTVFNGHVHRYLYTQRLGRDYIQLATSGGAFTPADHGEYLDHVLWVTVTDGVPHFLNLSLNGMRDKTGRIPYRGERPCFAREPCAE